MTKKILITGINGFIGSNCAEYFSNKGYEVFGIDLYSSGELRENFKHGEINITNLKSFNQEFDYILHLAGTGTVSAATKSPELEYTKTFNSTEHILEFMQFYNRKAKLIYSSSAAVYGDLYTGEIKETDILNPISVYGQHKVEVEQICKKYHENFNLDINIIRFFSIYGNGLKKQILWDFSNRLFKNKENSFINCFGTGEECRDFIHISDSIHLIEIMMNLDKRFLIVNGGTGVSTKIKNVLELLKNEYSLKKELVFDNIIQKGNPKSIIANTDLASSLGFKPKVDLEKGIKEYARFFKKEYKRSIFG